MLIEAPSAAEISEPDLQSHELVARETLVLAPNQPLRYRTIVVPTGLSTNREVTSIEIDTGDASSAKIRSAWIFGEEMLAHLVDEDETPGFEGAVDSRLVPLGTRVLLDPPPGITGATRDAWAWRLPPKHSLAVVVQLSPTSEIQLLKLRIKLSFKDRTVTQPIVEWLATDETVSSPYNRRLLLAGDAQLLTVVSDAKAPRIVLHSAKGKQVAETSWEIQASESEPFVGADSRIELGRGAELYATVSDEADVSTAATGPPSAIGLVLHAADEVDRTFLLQGSTREQWEHRRERCLSILEDNPRDTMARLTLALLDKQRGRTKESIKTLQQVVDFDATAFYARYHLANALASADQIDKAIAVYEEAIKLRPRHARAHFGLASLLFRQRRLEEAMEHLLAASEQEYDFAPIHTNLAVVYGLQGKTNKQMEHFTLASELDPDSTVAALGLAQALASQGRLAEAIGQLDTILQRRPNNEELLLARARLRAFNSSDDGVAAFDAILRRLPESIAAMTELADLLARRSGNNAEDVERAIYLIEYAAAAAVSKTPELLATQAECYLAAERLSDARIAVAEAMESFEAKEKDSAMLKRLRTLQDRTER